jgi:hypothetical protein
MERKEFYNKVRESFEEHTLFISRENEMQNDGNGIYAGRIQLCITQCDKIITSNLKNLSVQYPKINF